MVKVFSYASALTLCLVMGCSAGESPETPQRVEAASPASTTDVLRYLERVDDRALRQSFADLSRREYTQRVRTEQLDPNGTPIASEERVIRHLSSSSELLAHDSSGTFDYGYLASFVSTDVGESVAPKFPEYVIPDDPAYLSPRNREDYDYRMLPDTLLGEVAVRVIDISVREPENPDHQIRRARLYVDGRTDDLVGIYIERVDAALWYSERSVFYLSVRRGENGTLLPDRSRFETVMRVPFRSSQRFRTESTFYDFGGTM